ncbi:MAG: ADP-ribosylation factor-like protein [Candidatus Heimdallarchaeaceae archaeon]
MSSKIQSIMQTLRRKLGKPEVSILIMGNNTPATRNRVKLLSTYASPKDYIIDDSLYELPVDERFKFKPNLFEPFEGILYLIDATQEDMIKHERVFFWEKLMWNEELKEKPVAICAFNSNLQGSLTRGELIESLSLIRVTDRNWQLFEVPNAEDLLEALNWLKSIIWMGWTIDWQVKEALQEKLAKKQVVILEEEEN